MTTPALMLTCTCNSPGTIAVVQGQTNLSPGTIDGSLSVHVGKVKAVVNAEAHDHDASNGLDNAKIPVLRPLAKS